MLALCILMLLCFFALCEQLGSGPGTMPSYANVVHIGSVLLDVALLLCPVLAPKLRIVMPHDVDAVYRGLELLQTAAMFRPVDPPPEYHYPPPPALL